MAQETNAGAESSSAGQSSKRRKTSSTFGTADASERGQETLLPRRKSSNPAKKQAENAKQLSKSPVFKDMHKRTDRQLSQAIQDLQVQSEQARADRQSSTARTAAGNEDSAATINLDSLNLPPDVIELLEGKRVLLPDFARDEEERIAAQNAQSASASTSREAPPRSSRATKTYGKRSRSSTQTQAAHDAASKQSDQGHPPELSSQKKAATKRLAADAASADNPPRQLSSAEVIVPDTPQTSQQPQAPRGAAGEGHVSDEASETPSSKKRSRRRKQQPKRQNSPVKQPNETEPPKSKKKGKKRARVSDETPNENGAEPVKKKQKKHVQASQEEAPRETSVLPDSQVDELQSSAPSPVRETVPAPPTAQAAAQTVPPPPPKANSSAGVQASPPRPATTAQAAAQTAVRPTKHAAMQHQPRAGRSANRGMQTPQPSPPPERASAAAQTVALPAPQKAATSDKGVQAVSETIQQQQLPSVAYFARPAPNVAPSDLAARLQTPEGAEAWRQMCAYEEQMDRLAQAWSVQRARLFSSSATSASLAEPLSNAVLPHSLAEAPVALSAPTPALAATAASVPQISVASPPKPTSAQAGAAEESSSSEDASSSDTDSGSDTESRRRRENSNQLFPSNNKAAHGQRPPRKHAVAAPVKPRHSAPLPAASASASQPRLSPLNGNGSGSASRPRLSLGDLKVSISSDESEDDDDQESDEDEEEERDQTLTQLGSPEPEPPVRKPRLSITHDQRARSPSSDLPSSPRSASARSEVEAQQERRPAMDEVQAQAQAQSQSQKEDVISEEPAVQADADAALTEDQTAQREQQAVRKASTGDEAGFDTAASEAEDANEDKEEDKAQDAKKTEARGSPSRFSEASLPLDTVVANNVDEQAVSAASAAAPPATSQQNPLQDSQAQEPAQTAPAPSNGNAPIEEEGDQSEDDEEQDQLAQTQLHTQTQTQGKDQVVQPAPDQSTRESSPAQDSSSDASVKLREQLVTGAPTPQKPAVNGAKSSSPPKTGSQTSPPKHTQDLPKAPHETPLFNPTQPSSGDGKAESSSSSSSSSSSEDEEEEDTTARREGMTSSKRNSFPASDSRTTNSHADQPTESPPTPRPGLRQNGSLAHTLSSMLNRRNSGLGMRGSRQPPATQSPSSFNLPATTANGPISASQPTPRRSTRQTTASQSSTDNESDSDDKDSSSSSDSDGEDAGPQKAREKAKAIRLESASQPTRSKTRSTTTNGSGTPKAQQLPASQPARMTRSAGRRQTGTYGR